MENIVEDILLEDLVHIEWMTVRAINVCKDAGLTSLSLICDFFVENGSFLSIKNCGRFTEDELIEICHKYIESSKVYSKPVLKETLVEDQPPPPPPPPPPLTPFQRTLLNAHFDYLVSKLSLRSYNGLKSIITTINSGDSFEIVLSRKFDFKNERNIGKKSVVEFEKLKLELIEFKEYISRLQPNQLSIEFINQIIKKEFHYPRKNIQKYCESVFNEHGKVKLFSLIKILINQGHTFTKTEKRVFNLIITNNSENHTPASIANHYNISVEHLRHVKNKLEADIDKYFSFVSNLFSADLISYHIKATNNILIIDSEFVNKLNEAEGVDFNIYFYKKILGICYKKTHSNLGHNELVYRGKSSSNRVKYKNHYLIDNALYDGFDFREFVTDIYLKAIKKRSQPYALHFQGYLNNFLRREGYAYIKEICSACEAIIGKEFNLFVDGKGYLNIEWSPKKLIAKYCYQILENKSRPMKLQEIVNALNAQFPNKNYNVDTLRLRLTREKEIFIHIGRASTYGLKKWENEQVDIKGGTIRDVVEAFLTLHTTPKHISEILTYVLQFRPDTNEHNVMANIRCERNNRFRFYHSSFVGLKSKKYSANQCRFRKTLRQHFRMSALKGLAGLHFKAIVDYYVKTYGYQAIHVEWLLKNKTEHGELNFTKGNRLCSLR